MRQSILLRLWRRRVIVWILALGPAAAAAQDVAPGPPPGATDGDRDGPEEPDSPIATRITPAEAATAPPKPAALSSWGLWLRLGGSYDDNPRFLPDPEAVPEYLADGGGGLSFTRRIPRGEISLEGDAWLVRSQYGGDLDRYNYAGSLGSSYRLSPHVTTRVRGTYGYSDSRQSPVLEESGLLYPFVRTRTITGAGELAWQLSEWNDAFVRVDYEDVRFDTSSPFVGGGFLATSATFSHQTGPKTALGLSYLFGAGTGQGTQRPNHTAYASWGGRLGRGWNLGLSAGLTYVAARGSLSEFWTPYLSADVSRRALGVLLAASYTRSVGLAYGLGQERLADIVMVRVGRQLGGGVGVSGSYSWALNRDPSNAVYRLRSEHAGGGLSWAVARQCQLEAGYYWFRNESTDTSANLSSQRVTLSGLFWTDWP
jgi:hypothetical protein